VRFCARCALILCALCASLSLARSLSPSLCSEKPPDLTGATILYYICIIISFQLKTGETTEQGCCKCIPGAPDYSEPGFYIPGWSAKKIEDDLESDLQTAEQDVVSDAGWRCVSLWRDRDRVRNGDRNITRQCGARKILKMLSIFRFPLPAASTYAGKSSAEAAARAVAAGGQKGAMASRQRQRQRHTYAHTFIHRMTLSCVMERERESLCRCEFMLMCLEMHEHATCARCRYAVCVCVCLCVCLSLCVCARMLPCIQLRVCVSVHMQIHRGTHTPLLPPYIHEFFCTWLSV
jgi:hypothetical protein